MRAKSESSSPAVEMAVRVRDAEYRPLDNAKVALKVTLPGGDNLTIDAEPDGARSRHVLGDLRHEAAGSLSDTCDRDRPGWERRRCSRGRLGGSARGRRIRPPGAGPRVLETIASKTNGELVDGDNLASFVASLSFRSAPITEPWTSPLWHNPLYFLIAIACLAAEWGLRRVNGLA